MLLLVAQVFCEWSLGLQASQNCGLVDAVTTAALMQEVVDNKEEPVSPGTEQGNRHIQNPLP